MKLSDWFAKHLGNLPDVDIDVEDDVAAVDPATTAAVEAAPQNTGAPTTPTTPATPAATPAAEGDLAQVVNRLEQTVAGLQSERVSQAKNEFTALLDAKVKSFALNEADRAAWETRFDKLGFEVTMELLREQTDGAKRPAGVRAPQNRQETPAGGIVTLSADDARDPLKYRVARNQAREAGARLVVETEG
jgi:hypothetical protein